MAKHRDDPESHLIVDPAEQARFQNSELAQVRIQRAEQMVLRGELKKSQQQESVHWRNIKSKCGIDRDVAEQGLAAIDLPEAERLAKLGMMRRFFENAGMGEQASFMPAITPAKAPDQALDGSKVTVAQAAGFNAGMHGKPATDNPYAGGSAEGVAWSTAFGRAQEQIAMEMQCQTTS